jgi:hypothetical protein
MKTGNSILIISILALLAACGGGGGGTTTPPADDNPLPDSGIGRTGIAIAEGPIATFGSVVVNGVRYDTSSAVFTINGAPGSQDDLRVGQVVRISGTIDDDGVDGDADEVEFDDNVTGPIESIEVATGQIVVMGQLVLITTETSFDDSISPASIDGLADDIVEVSGLVDADGRITATRIEAKTGDTELEVLGVVSNLNAGGLLFEINGLVINYGAATLENFTGGTISNGDLVEVKGTSFGAGGELIATRVEREDGLAGVADGVHIEIQGFITRFQSAQDFDVTGLPVTTTANTVYEGGVEGDLALNVKIEVEGDVDASGVLVATKVDIRRAKAVRATATVDSVNATGNSLVLLGITVTIDNLTRLEDKSSLDVRPLTLANINTGDYVEVRGAEFPAGSGTILATILEREDADPDTILQGFVESIGQPSFTILGVTIQTEAGTVFRDANDNVISANNFFSQVAENSLVKVKGTEISSSVISAEEVEFELEF